MTFETSVANVVLNSFKNDSRVLKTSVSLASRYTVEVVALHDQGTRETETIQGVPVKRIKLWTRGLPKKSLLLMIVKYIEFFIRASFYCRRFNIIHCNDLAALPIGLMVKLLSFGKVRVVYDAHEYQTEVNGIRGIRKKLTKWLERYAIKHADAVVTVSDSIAKEYTRLYGIEKPALVLNCPKYEIVKKRNFFREELGIRTDQKIFLYQGGLSRGRGIEILLEAFGRLKTDNNVLVCMGYGLLEPEIKQVASQCSTVYFHPAVSPQELLSYTASADFGISLIEDVCLNYRYCLPNKLFEYLMAGLPVLVANLPEMRRFVEEYNVGVIVKNNTPVALLETLNEVLAKNPLDVSKSINSVRQQFCWEEQEKVLFSIYSRF